MIGLPYLGYLGEIPIGDAQQAAFIAIAELAFREHIPLSEISENKNAQFYELIADGRTAKAGWK